MSASSPRWHLIGFVKGHTLLPYCQRYRDTSLCSLRGGSSCLPAECASALRLFLSTPSRGIWCFIGGVCQYKHTLRQTPRCSDVAYCARTGLSGRPGARVMSPLVAPSVSKPKQTAPPGCRQMVTPSDGTLEICTWPKW